MLILKKFLLGIFVLTVALGNFLFIHPALAAGQLVKSAEFDTVYYIDSTGTRHPFPNLVTYQSWYGNDFSGVSLMTADKLAQYPIGKNITVRPGTYLVKIRTNPVVYAVTPGGVLRPIKDAEVAAGIYGQNWAKNVVDIPDVFFDNYTIGKTIDKRSDVPDGVLFQDSETRQYYYKYNGSVQPFASVGAIVANTLSLSNAVVSPFLHLFNQRSRPITGLDERIFNPVAMAVTDRRDCENENLKAAFIFLSGDSIEPAELAAVETIKAQVAQNYRWATQELSTINVSDPIAKIIGDSYILDRRNDGTTEIKNEIIQTFFDSHDDQYDFIFIFTDFKVPGETQGELAHFTPVANRQTGIKRDPLNWSRVYGSQGKLKGVITMGNIANYSTENQGGLNQAVDVVLHEILHTWAAYITYADFTGRENTGLLDSSREFQHWSRYVSFVSPLGGLGWHDNGDGTFTSASVQVDTNGVRPYSQLDLYLMGLIPAPAVDPVFYVVPADPKSTAATITGVAVPVTISQIVAANGPVQCGL